MAKGANHTSIYLGFMVFIVAFVGAYQILEGGNNPLFLQLTGNVIADTKEMVAPEPTLRPSKVTYTLPSKTQMQNIGAAKTGVISKPIIQKQTSENPLRVYITTRVSPPLLNLKHTFQNGVTGDASVNSFDLLRLYGELQTVGAVKLKESFDLSSIENPMETCKDFTNGPQVKDCQGIPAKDTFFLIQQGVKEGITNHVFVVCINSQCLADDLAAALSYAATKYQGDLYLTLISGQDDPLLEAAISDAWRQGLRVVFT